MVLFGGEAVADPGFPDIVHDVALLNSIGIRLVLVHGARPQTEQRLRARKAKLHYVNGLRITDDAALICVKEAAGAVRVEIEALLSMGLANTPMSGARIRVVSGNFVTARPLGVVDGIDYCYTGTVRRVDGEAIRQHLESNRVVLLSCLGYSPTGEVFNLSAAEIAAATAVELQAEKLIFLVEGDGLVDSKRRLISQLSPARVKELVQSRKRMPDELKQTLNSSIKACQGGVRRVHLISRGTDGALLQELFTQDGVGTLITTGTYEGLRPANIDDIGGILQLIEPLEADGTLVRRSRERLETEINHFLVVERDGMVVACSALYPYTVEGVGELACLAVHNAYRRNGRGAELLQAMERNAIESGIGKLFVLTTQTAHWFRERGFRKADIAQLPVSKRDLYNYQRNSKVFIKNLE